MDRLLRNVARAMNGAGAVRPLAIYGGRVVTMHPAQPEADALLLVGGRVHAVGSAAEVRAAARALGHRSVEELHVPGACVLPGLADAHLHLGAYGLQLEQLDLAGVGSLAEAVGLLVKPEVARRQIEDESSKPAQDEAVADPQRGGATPSEDPTSEGHSPGPKEAERPTRFHGTVRLDSARVGRDASEIADEVISHMHGLVGAEVTVTLEIEAKIPSGASEDIVRTVTENARTLKFRNQGFERE